MNSTRATANLWTRFRPSKGVSGPAVLEYLRPHGLQHPQAPLSVEFSRQEYWSGFSFPSPRDLPNTGIFPMQVSCTASRIARFFTTEPQRKTRVGNCNYQAGNLTTRINMLRDLMDKADSMQNRWAMWTGKWKFLERTKNKCSRAKQCNWSGGCLRWAH